MKCPDCNCDLHNFDFKGIPIEECEKCHGIWFTRQGLKRAKDATDEDLAWIDFDPFNKDGSYCEQLPQKKGCSVCHVFMHTLEYQNSGVVVNVCDKCEGVWLHKNEFEKMMKYLETLVDQKSSKDFVAVSFKALIDLLGSEPSMSKQEVKDFLIVLKLLKLRIATEHPLSIFIKDKIWQYFPFI